MNNVSKFGSISIKLFTLCLLVGTWCCVEIRSIYAQTDAFLISPYYGTQSVNQDYSSGHPAHDYSLNYTQVLAAASGTIQRVQWYDNRLECHGPTTQSDCGYGLHIYIQHNDNNNYVTRYGHLSSTAFALNSSGQAVTSGQIIGTSGNTGWSTGVHLHFEVKSGTGGNVDPDSSNLWKDGQWATPNRPIPQPVDGQVTITVNSEAGENGGFYKGSGAIDQNPCTSSSCGGWSSGGSYYYADVEGSTSSWAKWQPTNLITGIYDLIFAQK